MLADTARVTNVRIIIIIIIIISCFIKTQTDLTLLMLAYPRGPGKKAITRVSVMMDRAYD